MHLTDKGIRIALKVPIPSSSEEQPSTAVLRLSHFVPMKVKRRGVEMRIVNRRATPSASAGRPGLAQGTRPREMLVRRSSFRSSPGFDASVARMGLEVIATPVRSPKANSLCERLIGTLRRECLDWIIPLTEQHLRKTLWSWLPHYNRGRPHSSLGPGLPDLPLNLSMQFQRQRHRFDRSSRVVAHSVLNGLHHEYCLLARAA